MRRITLVLLFQDDVKPVAELVWSANRSHVVSAVERMRSDLDQLVEEGLSEWIGPYEDAMPRMTPSSDPRFLERLAAYLRRQFNFAIRLQDSEPAKRRDALQWPRDRALSLRERAEAR
jgi:hypothetical protein